MTTTQLKAKYRYLACRDRHIRANRRWHARVDGRHMDSVVMAMHYSGSDLWRAFDACHEVGLAIDHGMPFVSEVR